MKKLLNKKGFTLVELLAVIVVLAVIMVIATQAIGGVLKKNTADSFKSSLEIVAKQAKTAYLQYGENVTSAQIAKYVDYDPNQYEILLGNDTKIKDSAIKNATDKEKYVCIITKENGKFHNMDAEILGDYITKNPNVLFGDYCSNASNCNWDSTTAGYEVKQGTAVGCYKYR